MKICNEQDLTCYSHAVDKFRQFTVINGTQLHRMFHGCDCLPTCSHVNYVANLLNFNYASEKSQHVTSLKITYKTAEFLALQRIEKRTLMDMLVSFGGVLGLYLGGSLLSVIDLVFYCTSRDIYTLVRQKRKALVMQRKQLAIKKHTAVVGHH